MPSYVDVTETEFWLVNLIHEIDKVVLLEEQEITHFHGNNWLTILKDYTAN